MNRSGKPRVRARALKICSGLLRLTWLLWLPSGWRAWWHERTIPRPPHTERVATLARRAAAIRIAERTLGGATAANAIALEAERPNRQERRAEGHWAREPWLVLATVWHLAEGSGAPVAVALHSLADTLQSATQLRQQRDTALAGPRATTRLLLSLPPLGLLMGGALGAQPAALMLGSLTGAALFLAGAVFLLLGWRWSIALLRRVTEAERLPGLELDLWAIALGGGAPPLTARREVADALDTFGVRWATLEELVTPAGRPMTTVRMATAAGVPARKLLITEAAAARAEYTAELTQRTERLSVHMMLPLGLCVLPAYICVGVLPVLLAMLQP